MKKLFIVFAGLILLLGMTNGVSALTNPGFETGDTTGWTLSFPGYTDVVTGHNGDLATTYLPQEGSYFLRLGAGGGTNVYTTASQSIFMNAGDLLSGWAAFDYRDYHSFDDTAWVRIYDALGNIVATSWMENGLAHPNYWDGPWTSWSWVAANAGTYTLSYGVANLGDNSMSSVGLFDATVDTQPIPEPATMLLLGSGLVGLAGFARRRFKK